MKADDLGIATLLGFEILATQSTLIKLRLRFKPVDKFPYQLYGNDGDGRLIVYVGNLSCVEGLNLILKENSITNVHVMQYVLRPNGIVRKKTFRKVMDKPISRR